MAIIYFLQSDVVPTLLDAGVEIVLLTDDEIQSQISSRFGRPGLIVEGLRLKQANDYARKVSPRWQWLLGYLRRVGGSPEAKPTSRCARAKRVNESTSNKTRSPLSRKYSATAVAT